MKGEAMEYKRWLFAIATILIAFYTTLSSEAAVTTATIGKDGVQKVEIIGGSYFFKPNHIVVKVDIPVELKVSKEWSLIPHDIVSKFPEAGIEFQESLSSTPKTIKFTPTKVGKYPFYCSKKAPFSKSHREKGMEGVIEVVP